MSDEAYENALAHASIRPNGGSQGSDDLPVPAWKFTIEEKHAYWFSTKVNFLPNGDDFKIYIIHFGFKSKDAVGDERGFMREVFSPRQAEVIKTRIIDYFIGSEKKIVFPFEMEGSDCFGVQFGSDWIKLK